MTKQFHNGNGAVNSESLKRAMRRSLPRWYQRHKRDLPWRQTRDPYAIWVSEVMLQQTRVDVVTPYYHRWLKAFPTVQSLARAAPERVLRIWEGLGYYHRARNLQRAARVMAKEPPGTRRSYDDWIALPGIGRYTAAAIASIAFDQRVPVVDGNVARVVARVLAITDDVRQARTQQRMADLLSELMPRRGSGDFNQAMMELGALICTPKNPSCPSCPLRYVCHARADHMTDWLPNRGQSRLPKNVIQTAMVWRRGQRILVRRRPRTEPLLAGLWELPAFDRRRFRRGPLVATVRHGITNRRITLRVIMAMPADHQGKSVESLVAGSSSGGVYRWVTRQQAWRLPFSSAHRRALDQVFPPKPSVAGSHRGANSV